MEKEDFRRFMKSLVEQDPQTVVAFALKDAIYEGNLDRELALTTYNSELGPEFREPVLNADELFHVLWNGEHMILHLEFQRLGESGVPRKLWESNTMTTIITGKLVYTVVIYGVPEPSIPAPLYEERWPNGQVYHSFYFGQIKLWEIEPAVLEQPQFVRLLPLLPLAKGGQDS